MYAQPDVDSKYVTRLESVYLQNLDMPELIEKARVAVVDKASSILKADPDAKIDYIVLDLPCTFFMLRSLRWVQPSDNHRHSKVPLRISCQDTIVHADHVHCDQQSVLHLGQLIQFNKFSLCNRRIILLL